MNKINEKIGLVFLFIVIFAIISNAAILTNGKITLNFYEDKPVIESAVVKTNNFKDVITKNFSFFVLKSNEDKLDKAIEKVKFVSSVKENEINFHGKNEFFAQNVRIVLKENNEFSAILEIKALKELNLKKLYMVVKPGLIAENNDFLERAVVFKDIDGKITTFQLSKKNFTSNVISYNWIAFVNNYYTFLVFKPAELANTNVSSYKVNDKYEQTIKFEFSNKNLKKGESYIVDLKGYFGEKDIKKLAKLGAEELIKLGWFGSFAKVFLKILKKLNEFTHNWGVSIILLTILIRVVLYPLNMSQAKSMAKMQALQPEINKLKEKYKNDPQKLNIEMMELYKKHNVNPFGGCLPILIQIPILFALFTMLRTSIDIKGASFLWLYDLSKPDPYYILPILIAITMYYQQKLTSSDAQQQQMFAMMPIIMLVITISLPSGVLLYWFVSNILSFLQQLQVNKHIKGGVK